MKIRHAAPARRLLTLAVLLVTSLALAAPAMAKPNDHARGRHVPDPKIGVQLWTVRSALAQDVPATLEAIAEIGYRNVEPFSFFGYSAAEFKALLDEYGLKAPSMHVGVDALRDDLDQVIADARTIGARYVVLAWVAPEWRTAEGVEELAAILNEAGAELRRHGIKLAYHNHDFEFTTMIDGRSMYEVLTASTDPKLVQLQLDLYWVARAGVDPVEVIEAYDKRIATVHVKDMARDGSFADVGEGVLDFGAMFRAEKFRYYFVENDQPDDALDSIADSYRYLSRFRY